MTDEFQGEWQLSELLWINASSMRPLVWWVSLTKTPPYVGWRPGLPGRAANAGLDDPGRSEMGLAPLEEKGGPWGQGAHLISIVITLHYMYITLQVWSCTYITVHYNTLRYRYITLQVLYGTYMDIPCIHVHGHVQVHYRYIT